MTRRERIERKVALRRAWAESRQEKAAALYGATPDRIRHDWAFITQPGHIPERARMIARDDRAHAHVRMAQHHTGKAAGLEQQLASSIYSDDPDAIEALERRLAEELAEQAERKRRNALYRKGGWAAVFPDKTPEQIASLDAETAKQMSWHRCPHPAYELANANGRIKRTRDRIAQIKRQQEQRQLAEAAPNGVRLVMGKDWCQVQFAEKPDRDILAALRAAGFRWGGGQWSGPVAKLPETVRQLAEPPAP